MESKTLVEELETRRQAAGWSHRQFARELGVAPMTWSYVRRGERRPGARVIARILRRFPTLADVCVVELQRDRAFFMAPNVAHNDKMYHAGNGQKGGKG